MEAKVRQRRRSLSHFTGDLDLLRTVPYRGEARHSLRRAAWKQRRARGAEPTSFDMARFERFAMEKQKTDQPEKKALKLNVKILTKKTATAICEGGGGGGCGRAGNPAVAFH